MAQSNTKFLNMVNYVKDIEYEFQEHYSTGTVSNALYFNNVSGSFRVFEGIEPYVTTGKKVEDKIHCKYCGNEYDKDDIKEYKRRNNLPLFQCIGCNHVL